MRRLMLLLCVLTLLGAIPAFSQERTLTPGEGKAKEILDRTIQALGGAQYLEVRDIVRHGRLYSFDRGELASPGDRFVDYVKFPNKERLELGKKGNIIYVNDNDKGWELDRQGVRESTPESIETFQESLRHDFEYVLRFRLREEKIQLYYEGTEFVDNRQVHVVELVDERNESLKLYIDARNYLPLQMRWRQKDVLTGDYLDVVESYGKWISVQGIQTPMAVSRERGGRRYFEAYFDARQVQYNAGVDDSLFTPASLEERYKKVK